MAVEKNYKEFVMALSVSGENKTFLNSDEDNTELHRTLRKYALDGIWEAFETINTTRCLEHHGSEDP